VSDIAPSAESRRRGGCSKKIHASDARRKISLTIKNRDKPSEEGTLTPKDWKILAKANSVKMLNMRYGHGHGHRALSGPNGGQVSARVSLSTKEISQTVAPHPLTP
jgi:hypothetical protein